MNSDTGVPKMEMKYRVISILTKIREKPVIYIGQKSITLLDAFLCGYKTCLYEEHGYEDFHYINDFQEFVANKYGIKSSQNWSSIIRFYSCSESEAFDLFYKLFDEYNEIY